MTFVMTCLGITGFQLHGDDPAGMWLASYDAEARDGTGSVTWTRDPAEALRFVSQQAALDCWRRVPANRPVRGDGKPNRPLTAYTVTVEPAPS